MRSFDCHYDPDVKFHEDDDSYGFIGGEWRHYDFRFKTQEHIEDIDGHPWCSLPSIPRWWQFEWKLARTVTPIPDLSDIRIPDMPDFRCPPPTPGLMNVTYTAWIVRLPKSIRRQKRIDRAPKGLRNPHCRKRKRPLYVYR